MLTRAALSAHFESMGYSVVQEFGREFLLHNHDDKLTLRLPPHINEFPCERVALYCRAHQISLPTECEVSEENIERIDIILDD